MSVSCSEFENTINKEELVVETKIKSNKKKKVKSNKKNTSLIKPKELLNNQNVRAKLIKYGQIHKEKIITITTKFGDITIELFDDTPLHRASFIMLAKKKFFDSTIFYRVINNFMIQGGNSDSDNIVDKMSKIGFYRIPSEISPTHIHRRGAIAMAVREQYYDDPSKKDLSSSPYNFFIVQKGPITDKYMDKLETRYEMKISKKNRSIYKKYGGNPHLDNNYTVFGQVKKGMSVVDKISKAITNGKDRPIEDIFLTVKVN